VVAFLNIRNISPINLLSSKLIPGRYLEEEMCYFDDETENCNIRRLENCENSFKIGLCKSLLKKPADSYNRHIAVHILVGKRDLIVHVLLYYEVY
jgi:hypothetical protein